MNNIKEKYLVLKGCAGLGNRFITLMKAINYAKLSGRTLYVDWSDGMFGALGQNAFSKYFGIKGIKSCGFEDIMDAYQTGASCYPSKMRKDDLSNPIYEERDVKGQFVAYMPKMARKTIYKVALSVIPLHKLVYILGLQSFHRAEFKTNLSWKYVVKHMFDGENFPLGSNLWPWLHAQIVLFADFRPLVSMKKFFDYVSLKKDVYDKIVSKASELGVQNAIGIHVRYTDKKPKGQLDILHHQLKSILEADSSLKIFLCSDNPDVVEDFKHIYPDKVLLYEKFIPKVEDGGIHIWAAQYATDEVKQRMFEDSITEMWMLSMTKTLFWQGNSSFSYISKLLRDKENKKSIDWLKLK